MQDKDLIKEEVLETVVWDILADEVAESTQGVVVDGETDEVEEAPKQEMFAYSNFMLKCSCGHVEKLQESIQEGVMHYDIPTMEGASLALQCPSCLSTLTLYFEECEGVVVEDDAEPTDESNKEVENEQIPQKGKVQE